MFNVVFLVKRRPDLSPEAFARYWVEEHTPLTASVPGVRAYRVYIAAGPQDGEPAFDGVAVLSFEDRAAYEAALAPSSPPPSPTRPTSRMSSSPLPSSATSTSSSSRLR